MVYTCDYCGERFDTSQEKAGHMQYCEENPDDDDFLSSEPGTASQPVTQERKDTYKTPKVFGERPEKHPSECDHGADPPEDPRPTDFEEREVTIKADPEETLTVWRCDTCFVLRYEDPFDEVAV